MSARPRISEVLFVETCCDRNCNMVLGARMDKPSDLKTPLLKAITRCVI